MEILIGIIIWIIVIYFGFKFIKWLVNKIKDIFPTIIGIGVVCLVIYGIVYVIRNGSGIVFGNIINIIFQVLYFGISLIVLLFISAIISEILKSIRLRWLTIPMLIVLISVQLNLKSKDYVLSDINSFSFAVGISIIMFFWACFQFIRIQRNIGFRNEIDSNIMVYYAGMGSAFGSISMYLFDFPNILFHTNFNNIIYLNILVYIALLIAILSLNQQVNIFVKVKKYIKEKGYSNLNDILMNPLVKEKQNEKEIYAEQILLKMKKRKFIVEIGMKTPIYIQTNIYKCVLKEIKGEKEIDEIISLIKQKFGIGLTKDIIGLMAKISESKKDNNTILKSDIVSTFEEIVDDEFLDNMKHCMINAEFMLLRYDVSTHPIISAKAKYKTLYYNLLNYMLEDLKKSTTSVQIIMEDYIKLLNLSGDIKQIDKTIIEKEFKEITKTEIKIGFLDYRLRDYRFLLILETFYFRWVLTKKIEYDLINYYCNLLNIKEKRKNFIIKYIELFAKNQLGEAEELLQNCKQKHILTTVWPLHNNITCNQIYSSLPKYNVAVCATMSSGKSTFVNALLGYDYIPSRNEACTAKITSIADNDYLDSVLGGVVQKNGEVFFEGNISKEMLEAWNNDNKIERVLLETDLKGIKSEKGVLVVHDTPGTNYSQDQEHHNQTMTFLKDNEINLIIYLVNAEHVSTMDNRILLQQIKAEVIEKQSTQMIFLVNKLDSFDSEKQDDVVACLEGVKKELVEIGYKKPIVLPIVANAARLFKMALNGHGTRWTKREGSEFRNLYELFIEERFDLFELSRKIIPVKPMEFKGEKDSLLIDNKEYSRVTILEALQRTGITVVEELLDREINFGGAFE